MSVLSLCWAGRKPREIRVNQSFILETNHLRQEASANYQRKYSFDKKRQLYYSGIFRCVYENVMIFYMSHIKQYARPLPIILPSDFDQKGILHLK